MMAPLANNEHQDLQFELASAIKSANGSGKPVRVHTGANVIDRERAGNTTTGAPMSSSFFPAASRATAAPTVRRSDFCIEISAPVIAAGQARLLPGIVVRELLLIDRDPWVWSLPSTHNS